MTKLNWAHTNKFDLKPKIMNALRFSEKCRSALFFFVRFVRSLATQTAGGIGLSPEYLGKYASPTTNTTLDWGKHVCECVCERERERTSSISFRFTLQFFGRHLVSGNIQAFFSGPFQWAAAHTIKLLSELSKGGRELERAYRCVWKFATL